jgi:hypothetical protein
VFVKFSIGLNADYTDPRWEQKVTEGIKENELLGYFQGFPQQLHNGIAATSHRSGF